MPNAHRIICNAHVKVAKSGSILTLIDPYFTNCRQERRQKFRDLGHICEVQYGQEGIEVRDPDVLCTFYWYRRIRVETRLRSQDNGI